MESERLEELFWKLDLGPRHRVELLEGQIVVSPKAAYWHRRVVNMADSSIRISM